MEESKYDLFLSFARDSDEAYVIREIVPLLQSELHSGGLKNINIWLNLSEEPATAAWDQVIAGESRASAFLLAFVTPAWFEDPLCRLEAQLFQSIERQIGQRNLILPVLFQSMPDLENPTISIHQTLAADLASRSLLHVDEISHNSDGGGTLLTVRRLASLLQSHFGNQGIGRDGQAIAISSGAESSAEPELEGPQLLAPERPTEDLRRLATEEGAAKIKEWFLRNYERPEHETPRPDGEYLYIWGGPYEPFDVIHVHFSELATQEQLDQAVTELNEESFYWAPAGNRVLPPDDDSWQNRRTNWEKETRPWNDERISAETAHREMLQRIEQLEAKLNEIEQAPASIGHNRPPDSIPDEVPVTQTELDQLSQDLAYLKAAPAQPRAFRV
jgi:hypothetical protein